VPADADRDRGSDEVALVVGEPEGDLSGVLRAQRVMCLEVGQRPRREVVALRSVGVQVVERL
jgi:hypothetical protein